MRAPRKSEKTGSEKIEKKRATYADYLTWPDEKRCEIIGGEIYDMTPAPGTAHQELLFNLAYEIRSFIGKGPCKVFLAPFDVRLTESSETSKNCSNVVQPDISVICDEKKLDDKGCKGAPDWIIEILSPSTASKDNVKKKHLYEKHGVKEYWLIHPIDRTAMIYVLTAGKFALKGVFDETDTLKSEVFKGFAVKFKEILPAIKVVKEKAVRYF